MIILKRRPGTISFARFKLGISQQQLADALGVSRSMVAMFETGKRKLPRDVAAIYLDLCTRAASINPGEAIIIRRGRKPILSQNAVTNFKPNGPANNEGLSLHWLSSKRVELEGERLVALFNIKSIEQKAKQISEAVAFADVMVKVHAGVLEVLSAGKQKDKYELKLKAMQFRQLKLGQALKYVPVEMLKAEFRLGLVEAGMEAFEVIAVSEAKNADSLLMLSGEFEMAA